MLEYVPGIIKPVQSIEGNFFLTEKPEVGGLAGTHKWLGIRRDTHCAMPPPNFNILCHFNINCILNFTRLIYICS